MLRWQLQVHDITPRQPLEISAQDIDIWLLSSVCKRVPAIPVTLGACYRAPHLFHPDAKISAPAPGACKKFCLCTQEEERDQRDRADVGNQLPRPPPPDAAAARAAHAQQQKEHQDNWLQKQHRQKALLVSVAPPRACIHHEEPGSRWHVHSTIIGESP